ncbi:MAG: DNA gyrase subunit A [Oligoflexales bacterium]|nr:DNA gyrase subunit A [Oligoflexales bacterium]
MSGQETENIVTIHIEQELKNSFLDYSMSVIVSRALPDVRDGLKPVHRRILYAMNLLKNYHNRPYLKSARIVGDVIGRFHPHGDASVYEALVRLAQSFSMRYMLVDGQGNFGSIDGDSAAAMRYTESRLQEMSELMLHDIDKETVDFVPNYDNKELEPTVLPTKIPQLIINGAQGIAVGMATNIPPHNLREVVEAMQALIDDPDLTIADLVKYIKGPDFPTRGVIYGRSGILQAYATGRGSIMMRGVAEVEEVKNSGGRERIVITEIPYQVNKAKLIEKIADLVREKKLEGITDIRDESAKEDIRIVIDLRKGEMGEIILNNLFKMTPLQSSFGVNLVALTGGIPKLMNLKHILEEFYFHRREVVLRSTAFDLKKAEERAHILLGLKTAVENIDEVVKLIRAAPDTHQAQAELIERFKLSEIQAKAILDMRLARLTGLERDKIVQEYNEILAKIADLNNILETPARVTKIIKADLEEIKERFGDERKTMIIETAADDLTMEKLVADEDVAVTISMAGYVKRTPLNEINAQKRGGKGRSAMLTKEEDVVKDIFISSNHQDLLVFTNKAKVYALKVYQIPEAGLRSRGKHFANLIEFDEGEAVVSVLPVKEYTQGYSIVSVTSNGYIKKTDLLAYQKVRSSGIIGLKLDEGDNLVSCDICCEGDNIIIASKMGKAIRFNAGDIREMGRASRGVTGIRFSEENDCVIGMQIVRGTGPILSVCENGYGKRTELEEYRQQGRGGKGIITIKVTERNGPVVGIAQVSDSDDVILMTTEGKIVRVHVKEISMVGRNTQGVRLVNVSEGEKVISFCVAKEDDSAAAEPILEDSDSGE